MKALRICSVVLTVLLFHGIAGALTIDIFQADDSTAINSWITGLGSDIVVWEDFEDEVFDQDKTTNWYQSLDTGVGTFAAGGLPGLGDTSYLQNGGDEQSAPHFAIRNEPWYGRGNTTDGDASNYLDSGDITELTLDLNVAVNNLFFYIQDPSDVRAITTVSADGAAETFLTDQDDGSLWFVGIVSEDILSAVSWTTSTQKDGYGLDDFSSVAPVPEPSTMLLLGTGLIGLAGMGRRKLKRD